MSCPGSLRHQDYLQPPREKLNVLLKVNHASGYGDIHIQCCKEGLFKSRESGCRYCTIQYCWVLFKVLSIRIWQEENKEGKNRNEANLSEQERMNHRFPSSLSHILSKPEVPVLCISNEI